MQIVFESTAAPEAHKIKILLESKGIYSVIDGEHLQTGAGVLQDEKVIRVIVDDSDFIAASGIIDEWKSG